MLHVSKSFVQHAHGFSFAGYSVGNGRGGVRRPSPEMSIIHAHGGSVCGIKTQEYVILLDESARKDV
jgi:hypothetical protein